MMTTMTKQSPWMESATAAARLTTKKFTCAGTDDVIGCRSKLVDAQQDVLMYYKSEATLYNRHNKQCQDIRTQSSQ